MLIQSLAIFGVHSSGGQLATLMLLEAGVKPKPLVLSSDNSPMVMVMVMAMEAILICALRWQEESQSSVA